MAKRLVAVIASSIKLLIGLLAAYTSLRLYSIRLRLRYWLWSRRFSRSLANSGVPVEYRRALLETYRRFLESQRLRIPGPLSLLGAETRPGHWLFTSKEKD